MPQSQLYKPPFLWQFFLMGLLPKRIEFSAVNIGYDVALAGEYAQKPARKKLLSLSLGNLRMCLEEAPGELRLFGPARGCALHILILQAFARCSALKLLGERISFLGEKLGYGQFTFRVGDQRKRWGSCSKREGRLPKICLNWRALLLSPRLLDQLCVHELCHLRVMNHSAAFHALMLAANPNAREDERALSRAFATLPHWAVHSSHFATRR